MLTYKDTLYWWFNVTLTSITSEDTQTQPASHVQLSIVVLLRSKEASVVVLKRYEEDGHERNIAPVSIKIYVEKMGNNNAPPPLRCFFNRHHLMDKRKQSPLDL